MSAGLRRVVVGLLFAAVAAPGLSVPGAVAAGPRPVVVDELYLDQQVDWETCDFDGYVRSEWRTAPETLCTTVVVPMDWRDPGAHPDVTVAISLSRATGRSQGLLTANPGGPGVEALETPVFLAALAQPRLFTDYDLLGFDPRGYGMSQSAFCRAPEAARAAVPSVLDHRVRNRATHRAETAQARFDARYCAASEFNRFVSTEQTVHDLEFVRAYLQRHHANPRASYDKLNYIGFSYGTWLGAWYADTYPKHTGRFLLDSSMDWTSSMAANQRLDTMAYQRRRDQMLFPWLARHHQRYRLGSTTAQVARNYERIRTGVARAYAAGLSPATAQQMDEEIVNQLPSDSAFADAAAALVSYAELAETDSAAAASSRRSAAGRAGTAGPIDGAQRRSTAEAAPAYEWETNQLVRCNDSSHPRDINAVLRQTDADTRRYRFVGYWNAVSMCNYWPRAATDRRVDLAGAPTMLMLQSEADPSTAYEGALAAHRASGGRTRLVSVADSGQHGIYLSETSPCADRIAEAFLFQGRLPARDTTCTARPLPRDTKVYPVKGAVAAPTPARPTTSRPTASGRADVPEAAAVHPRLEELWRRVAAAEARSR